VRLRRALVETAKFCLPVRIAVLSSEIAVSSYPNEHLD